MVLFVRRQLLPVGVLLWLWAALAALAGFTICPKCGYENDAASAACSHCAGALAAAEPSEPPPAAETEEAGIAPRRADGRSPDVIDEEVQRGLAWLRQGEVEAARLWFRNAAALNGVVAHPDQDAYGERMMVLLNRCEAQPLQARRECPACAGAGRLRRDSPSLAGSAAGLDLPEQTCPACGGSGAIRWTGTMEDRAYARGRALRDYRTAQQVCGRVPVGGAWLPAEWAATVSVRERVQLKRATVQPCAECRGFGRADCGACKGQGRVRCPERGCVNGVVTVERDGGLTRSTMTQTRACAVCRGKGFVACDACQGRGSLLCDRCKGTGESVACRRCGGDGLASCRRCSGRGTQRGAACEPCGGEGVGECSACDGDGRRE